MRAGAGGRPEVMAGSEAYFDKWAEEAAIKYLQNQIAD